jgi:hypothetical protein
VSRKQTSWSTPPRRERRHSYSYRTSHGDSDEDEYEYVDFLLDGVIYREYSRRPSKTSYNYRGRGTDQYYYSQAQGYPADRDDLDEDVLHELPPRRRRPSTSTPQRSHTARPAATPVKKVAIPKATEDDARKHRIPPGYSLKNWDPAEEPIMLLGSVFDANSLGKWIYDWTVYHHGSSTPFADVAGELWLLLIQLAGKVRRAEECMLRIRTADNKEMVEDFIESGERLMDKLKKLLKACETPMLRAGKKGTSQLGKNAGTEFVDSIFGRDRQLEQTEKFMASIRLWNMRFDANCEDILRRPGQ